MALFSNFFCGYWVGKEGRPLRLVKSFRRVESLPERVNFSSPGGVMLINRCLGRLCCLCRNVGLYLKFLKCCGEVGQGECQEDGRRNMHSPIFLLFLVEGANQV